MVKTIQISQRFAGVFASLLSIAIAVAWYSKNPTLLQWLPGTAALGALCFALAALALLLPWWQPQRAQLVQTGFGIALVVVAAGNLLYLAFRRGTDLGAADWQRWSEGVNVLPVPMPFVAAAAFLLIGFTLSLSRFRQDRTLGTLGRVALLLVLALSSIALLGALLQMENLYVGYVFNYLSADMALGVGLVSAGLWMSWRRDGTCLPRAPDRGVTSTSVMVLICTALGVGITTWVTEQQHLANVLGDGLRLALKSRVEQITMAVDLRVHRADIMSGRPAVLKNMRALINDPHRRAGHDGLNNVLHAFEPFGFSGLALTLPDGSEVFRLGTLLSPTEHRMALTTAATEIVRSNGFYLRSRMPLSDEQGTLGTLIIEQPMPDLTAAFSKLDDLGRGDELLLCSLQDGDLRCFPSGAALSQSFRLPRNAPDWTQLAAPALAGNTGVGELKDFRQREMVGAYAPVGRGLIAVLKSDTAHLYGPLTQQFYRVLLITLILIGVGTGLIYLRVRPLLNALRLGEKRLQLALDASASHVWDLDLRTQLLTPDRGFFELLDFGDDVHPLSLEQWQRWLHPEDLEKDVTGWTALLQRDGTELRLRNRQGEYRWFNFRGGVVENDAVGRPLRALGTARDATERKRMEQELVGALIAAEDANHAKSQFLSSMSHELRTPLNGVLGYVQMLLADPTTSSTQQRQLNAIESCGQHLLTLINDVLDLAKIESGTLEVENRDCNLYDLLESVSDIVRERASSKKLIYTVEIEKTVPAYIRTDAIKLRQILVNLLGNAIKFTHAGSVGLRVATRPAGKELLFQVRDTGIGIPLEKQQEIFKPFRQVNRSAGGTGLGLSISQRLCEALGGKLLVHSAVGTGSCFSFSLPFEIGEATKAAPQQRLAHPIIDLRAMSLTIMVVDDNPINRQVLAGMLRANGIEVVEAEHGKDALEKLRIQPVPLILMDVRMPVMDGFAATRAIKANPLLRGTRVIAVSASVFPDTIEGMLSAGCDDFIKKPVRVRELLEKVALHLQLPLRENSGDKENTLPG